ncbi:unnamed protein product (mitochondrion) [Plasmodiophora brassicae]|uniref:Uncharacterized protein n=1 Tax=Plasmodiophora brassicae TaxID=37360 RepID=A0A3P3YC28_PLABS|nr:unnamed protein product [Plasmodiophora brassicae]
MNYSADTPAIGALTDVNASAMSPPVAVPIVAGAPLEVTHVCAAKEDVRSRKRPREADPGAPRVTGVEIAAAQIREHAVIAEHAAQTYPGAGAPVWFASALQGALQRTQAHLLQQVQRMQAGLLQQVQRMQAHAESRSIARVLNSAISEDGFALHPLVGNDGAVPSGFPATTDELKGMRGADVNALLQAYGLVPIGNVAHRRQQLGTFLGLYSRFH